MYLLEELFEVGQRIIDPGQAVLEVCPVPDSFAPSAIFRLLELLAMRLRRRTQRPERVGVMGGDPNEITSDPHGSAACRRTVEA